MTSIITGAEVQAIVDSIRLPSLQVYGGDWLRDPVSGCSVAANGLWFRMMLMMHDAKPYGHLVGANGQPLNEKLVARQSGCDGTVEFKKILAELDEVGVPGHSCDASYDPIFVGKFVGATIDFSPLKIAMPGVIYSRRMVRDQRLRVIRRLAARLGVNARALMKEAARAVPLSDEPGQRQLSPQQQNVKLVLDAVVESLRPEFDPGRVAMWIKKLGSADAVAEIVRRYPTKPADYIEKVVQTESRKEPNARGNNASKPVARSYASSGTE